MDPDYRDGAAFFWPGSPQKRAEARTVMRLRPIVFQSVYQLNPGAREGQIFLESDFTTYTPPQDLELGIQSPHVRAFMANAQETGVGWDTAMEAKSTADFTVGVTAMFAPCDKYHRGESPFLLGPCEPHFDVYILDVFREQLDWGGLTAAFRKTHVKWQPEVHVIEKKQSGISLYQAAQAAGMNVEGVTSGESKRARAIEGVGAGSAQGWFRLHRVVFPANAPWLPALKRELKDFSGDGAGKDDQVDAVVHIVNYAIQLGSRCAILPTGWTPERVDAMMMGVEEGQLPNLFPGQRIPEMVILGMMGSVANSIDPFEHTCGRCHYFSENRCNFHLRSTTSLDQCWDWAERLVA